MKSIRFYSILVFSLFILWSCSSDDDAPTGPTVSNQVFRTWQMEYFFEDGQTISDIPCESDIKYMFNSNKNYSKTLFIEAENANNCDESVVINGRWEIVEDNVLRLIPSSSVFNSETVSLNIINNNQLEIRRSSNLTQFYKRL